MKLLRSLAIVTSPGYQSNPVLLFSYSREYPVLFFSLLLQRLAQSNEILVKHVGDEISDQTAIEAHIRTTFLGKTHTIWFGNISDRLEQSARSKFVAICSEYQGPHRLIVCLESKDVPKSWDKEKIIDLSESLSLEEKNKVLSFLYPLFSEKSFKKIHDAVGHIASVESLITLAQYGMVVGKNTDLFIQEWLSKIIVPESSLFLLAQYFFGRKISHFWNAWYRIKHEYPATFWTVFWSEQVWRAYAVIVLQQQGNLIEARKMAYRLPFSFLQKDSQDIQLYELSSVHYLLYEIEWRIKNGGSEEHFDVLFYTFFSRSY